MEDVDNILVTFKDGTSEMYSKKSMKRFQKKFFPAPKVEPLPALDPRYKTMSVSYNPVKGDPHKIAKELEHQVSSSSNVYMPKFGP